MAQVPKIQIILILISPTLKEEFDLTSGYETERNEYRIEGVKRTRQQYEPIHNRRRILEVLHSITNSKEVFNKSCGRS